MLCGNYFLSTIIPTYNIDISCEMSCYRLVLRHVLLSVLSKHANIFDIFLTTALSTIETGGWWGKLKLGGVESGSVAVVCEMLGLSQSHNE